MKLELKIIPDTSNEVVSLGAHELTLKVACAAPGALSNFDIVKILSELLKVKKRDIKIFDSKFIDSKIVELPDSVKIPG